jgi:hypothetical protein
MQKSFRVNFRVIMVRLGLYDQRSRSRMLIVLCVSYARLTERRMQARRAERVWQGGNYVLPPFPSARDLFAEEIDRRPDLRAQQFDFLPIEKGMGGVSGIVSFVAIQVFPNDRVQDLINLDGDDARLFDDSRISMLRETEPPQQALPIEPETLHDGISLSRETSPPKRPISGEKSCGRGSHWVIGQALSFGVRSQFLDPMRCDFAQPEA